MLCVCSSTTIMTHLRPLLYLLYLHCDNWQKSPTPRFAHCGSLCHPPAPSHLAAARPSRVEPRHVCRRAHSTLSRCAPSLPLRVVPRPSPRRGAIDTVVPHQEIAAAVAPAPPRRSTSARNITRFGVARPGGASPAAPCALFLPRMLQARVVSVYFKCFRCFICMLQVFHVDVA
jgi:hypothetical protein